MKKNIAVVGCGHWGKNLVRNFAELGVLYCVCDPEDTLSEHFAVKYQTKAMSFDQILSDPQVEGVILAVPAKLHAEMAIRAMRSKKNVFVEKPIAMNQSEAALMIEASIEENVHLMVGHLLQYHPIFLQLKSLIKMGHLGELTYLYSNRLSFGQVRAEEDVIWSFAPHDISMILSLAEQEPDTVEARTSNVLQENIADIGTIHMTFSSGLKAHISVSWIHPVKEQKLVVIGGDAMAVFDDTQPWDKKLAIYRHGIDRFTNPPKLRKADAEYVVIDSCEPLKQECSYFLELIADRAPPVTDGQEGLRVLNVLTRASLRT